MAEHVLPAPRAAAPYRTRSSATRHREHAIPLPPGLLLPFLAFVLFAHHWAPALR